MMARGLMRSIDSWQTGGGAAVPTMRHQWHLLEAHERKRERDLSHCNIYLIMGEVFLLFSSTFNQFAHSRYLQKQPSEVEYVTWNNGVKRDNRVHIVTRTDCNPCAQHITTGHTTCSRCKTQMWWFRVVFTLTLCRRDVTLTSAVWKARAHQCHWYIPRVDSTSTKQ